MSLSKDYKKLVYRTAKHLLALADGEVDGLAVLEWMEHTMTPDEWAVVIGRAAQVAQTTDLVPDPTVCDEMFTLDVRNKAQEIAAKNTEPTYCEQDAQDFLREQREDDEARASEYWAEQEQLQHEAALEQ